MSDSDETSAPDLEIVAALLRGSKIEAIKLYRARHPQAELVDAKREVERIERTLPPDPTRPRGCARNAAAILALLSALSALWACR